MAIIKRKQPGRKQLKRPYKIPRSLKKSIKKNLVKIVKKRERKIRDEEHEQASTQQEEYHGAMYNHLIGLNEAWIAHQDTHTLSDALEPLIGRLFHSVGFEAARRAGGLSAQKEWARYVLGEQLNKEMRDGAKVWLIEQGEDVDEIAKLGKEEEVKHNDGVEDGDNELGTTEEYDWTSTSTLE